MKEKITDIVVNDLVYYKNLKIVQNKNYFNFSLDSILLPNFVYITTNTKNILDLCTGNAPIPLVLSKKTKANIIGVDFNRDTSTIDISLFTDPTPEKPYRKKPVTVRLNINDIAEVLATKLYFNTKGENDVVQ